MSFRTPRRVNNMTISCRCQSKSTPASLYLIENRTSSNGHRSASYGRMTAASARLRLTGMVVTFFVLIAGICQAAAVLIPVQLAMGGKQGPIPQTRTAQTPPAPPAKPQGGLTPDEQKRFTEAVKRLTPKERKRLTKAIKKFTPEESRQFLEGVKRQLATKAPLQKR